MNNNTKARYKQLTKKQRSGLAVEGKIRKSKHAKVAWNKGH